MNCSSKSTIFKFIGKPIERYVINKSGEEIQRLRTLRTKKQPKRRRSSVNNHTLKQSQCKSKYKNGNYERVKYRACVSNNVEYKIGDDILLLITDGKNQRTEIARIREIFKDDNFVHPKIKISWFWTMKEVFFHSF